MIKLLPEVQGLVLNGDCLQVLKELEDNSVDSLVSDPPYELGFMGKSWDNTGIANNIELWKECLRVLKPGAYLLAFGGTRTYHRMACAIEDAGFEIRDMIEWTYGSGFPKSLNIGKAIDKMQGNEREVVGESKWSQPAKSGHFGGLTGEDIKFIENKERFTPLETKGTSAWEGYGTALKPAHEPIVMARKPLAEKTVAENVLKYGTGGINIDESRVGNTTETHSKSSESAKGKGIFGEYGEVKTEIKDYGRFPANLIHDGSEEVLKEFPNVKTGSITKDIDGRSSNSLGTFKVFTGRHNGDNGSASRFFKQCEFDDEELEFNREQIERQILNYPSFFYCAKASKSERNEGCEEIPEKFMNGMDKMGGEKCGMLTGSGNPRVGVNSNNHPTVKPLKLMEYLIKMVTPKGGVVLDPFAGSGTTLVASKKLGYKYIGIELTKEYIPIINARLEAVK